MRLIPEYLDPKAQIDLCSELQSLFQIAPLYTPTMPKTGKPFSVASTNCGPLGWVSDKVNGYRYQAHHPETGKKWPQIPAVLADMWRDIARFDHPPEACLINYYRDNAKMGLHQDRDEADFDAPVVSLSLGDTAIFRIGGTKRKDPTNSVRLASGDVVILEGATRLAYHGIDRILPQSSSLFETCDDPMPNKGRINITMRRVSKPL